MVEAVGVVQVPLVGSEEGAQQAEQYSHTDFRRGGGRPGSGSARNGAERRPGRGGGVRLREIAAPPSKFPFFFRSNWLIKSKRGRMGRRVYGMGLYGLGCWADTELGNERWSPVCSDELRADCVSSAKL